MTVWTLSPLTALRGRAAANLHRSAFSSAHTPLPPLPRNPFQEWRNAIALFVNVASAKGAFYRNLFLDGGRKMTWFAQPTHVPETPAIKRILATRRDAEGGAVEGAGAAGEQDVEVPVVLFCRQARPRPSLCSPSL